MSEGEIGSVYRGEVAFRSLGRVGRQRLERNLMGRDLKRYSRDRSRFVLGERVGL